MMINAGCKRKGEISHLKCSIPQDVPGRCPALAVELGKDLAVHLQRWPPEVVVEIAGDLGPLP